MSSKFNQFGDTIIEVLIAIAILSLVLMGAYSISSRSLASIRQAQEHTIALKFAESQVEYIKSLANSSNETSEIFTHTGNFCIISGSTPGSLQLGTDEDCVIENGVKYNISVSRAAIDASGSYKFTILVNWLNIHGNASDDKVTLIYKI